MADGELSVYLLSAGVHKDSADRAAAALYHAYIPPYSLTDEAEAEERA